MVGDLNLIDAEEFLPAAFLDGLRQTESALLEPAMEVAHATAAPSVVQAAQRILTKKEFGIVQSVSDPCALHALLILLSEFGEYKEIFLTPYLNRLREVMSQLADYQRKALIHDLEMAGAIKVERRRGEPHDYSVVIVN